jgi:hypothetical protein
MMENLDLKCAELGKQFADIKDVDENLLRDALSVLEEQGVYAFFLYLEARGKQPGKAISRACVEFLQKTPSGSLLMLAPDDVWQALQRLGEDLDKLLFARDLLRQALVYGRYHVKADSAARGSS